VKDFEPISLVAFDPQIIAVKKELRSVRRYA
jgi:hypothetical protein